MFVAICAFAACDPTHEKINNGGHITVDELVAKTVVTTDIAADGKNGNVLTCETLAPVSAKWTIAGKDYKSNSAKAKMRVGQHTVTLTALCADGTKLTADFPVTVDEETDPIMKHYFYGEDPAKQPEFWLESGDAAGGRFSDAEGKYFPYLDGNTYFGLKTLVFEITDAQEGQYIWGEGTGLTVRIMNGWWNPTFADDVPIGKGYWELPITEAIAKSCAKSEDGGDGKDLDLLMTRGRVKIKSCYYEY